MPDWQTEALPVLHEAYHQTEAAEIGTDVTSATIAEALGRPVDDQRTLRTVSYLKEAGYIDGGLGISQATGEMVIDEITIKPEALKYVAGWPGSPEAAAASFLVVLQDAIDNAPPEERARLERFKESALSVGQGTLSGVLGRILMGG